MTQEVLSTPQDPKERILMAFETAMLDKALLDSMARLNYDRNEISCIISNLSKDLLAGHINCATIRNEIRGLFPKQRSKETRDLALKYRQHMHNWVNGASPFPYPPSLTIQRLPELNSSTLKRYLSLFEKLAIKGEKYTAPDASVDRGIIESAGDVYELHRYDFESRDVGAAKCLEIDQPAGNVESALVEYVNRSEENAVQVLIHILNIKEVRLCIHYRYLVQKIIKRLSGNIHFIRSLFNLIDENTNSENPSHPIESYHISTLLHALNFSRVTSTYDDGELERNSAEPREYHLGSYHFEYADGGSNYEIRIKTPCNYLPVHWNINRLVNPCLNISFQEFARILEENIQAYTEDRMREGMTFIDELERDRRYGLEFSRVKVSEIPGAEDMDIWFNYSHTPEMEPSEIRVEVVVNDAGIVYYLNNGRLEMRGEGNAIPYPKDANEPNHIDSLYGHDAVRQWASPNAQVVLFYYIAKYAHALLILPRTTGEKSKKQSPETDNPFNFRLREHSTETYMPGNTNGEGGQKIRAYHETAFHAVAPHVRNLPPGKRASVKAVAEAAKYHIFLAPGQTFVRPHTRGSEVTEQGRGGRGITVTLNSDSQE